MTKDTKPATYQLIHVRPGKEETLFTSVKRLDVELEREKHIRSITTGYVEIRQA